MPLLAYGINYQATPVALREQLAFHAADLSTALQDLTKQPAINEAVILSTCNRTEIYTQVSDYFPLQQWLCEQKCLKDTDLSPCDYAYHEIDAVRHMMRVASGLDSMALGEPQVFGQMKQAYQIAYDAGTTDNLFKQLFPAIFAASKQIRTQTDINTHPVSLAYTTVQLAKQIYPNLSDCKLLLIGAGETITLIATHLQQYHIKQITIANRTLEKARAIAKPLQAHAISIDDIQTCLKEVGMVIAATTSQLPILNKHMLANARKQKKEHSLYLIDLGMPRNIDPSVSTLNAVRLYNIDDLQKIMLQNLKNRQAAAVEAESLIDSQATGFLRQIRIDNAKGVITGYRKKLASLHDIELEKALTQLKRGIDPEVVIAQFGRGLMNKIMHNPTIKLREAASESQLEKLQLVKTLFEME